MEPQVHQYIERLEKRLEAMSKKINFLLSLIPIEDQFKLEQELYNDDEQDTE